MRVIVARSNLFYTFKCRRSENMPLQQDSFCFAASAGVLFVRQLRSTETVSANRQRLLSSFNESFLSGRRDRFELTAFFSCLRSTVLPR